MSARVYRDDLRCPRCGSNRTPKDGHSRGKQTYRCGQCRYRFTSDGNRHYYSEAVKTQAVTMYVEGMCVLAIGRTLGVKPGMIYSWLKKVCPGPKCAAGVPAAAATVAVGAGGGDCV